MQSRVDRDTVTERLADEFREAAHAARHGRELELARSLEERVDVMGLAADLRGHDGAR